MQKIDFKKTFKHLYAPPKDRWVEVDVSPLQYLMVDGQGSPGEAPEYFAAVEWLFSVSYPLKFMSKKELGRDYAVMPLEGVWFADDFSAYTQAGRRDEWRWTLMILQPEWISAGMVEKAVDKTLAKRNDKPESLRLDTLHEGRCLTKLHIGPFADEAPALHHLHHDLMPSLGLTFNGHHHEIYLSDPRKTAPEKLKTVLRQPVRSA
ncbi:MAG TPA: GyrI-like domain-containing protein [Rhizobiaceae bacterium]|nr:GyrI-like domain-containing protein [Rhizobiaceae bacterium]